MSKAAAATGGSGTLSDLLPGGAPTDALSPKMTPTPAPERRPTQLSNETTAQDVKDQTIAGRADVSDY